MNHNVNMTIVLHLWVNMLCCQFKIYPYLCIDRISEAAKKSSFFSCLATKSGEGGLKAGPLRKKKTFFNLIFDPFPPPPKKKNPMAINLEGEGGVRLVPEPLKKDHFLRLSL